MSKPDFDVLVAGGGTVGASAAVLLARCGLQVALVDQKSPDFDSSSDIGLRVSAISPGSVSILEQVGAWQDLDQARACAYRRMRVEDRSSDSAVEFEAARFGLERLGTIVENELLRSAVWQQVESSAGLQVFCPARVEYIDQNASAVRVRLDDGTDIQASVLLGSDGAQSQVRRWMGVDGDAWSYNQFGLVTVVTHSEPNPGIAWQRFLPGGPLAFLPLNDGRSSIVWSLPSSESERLLEASEDQFCQALEQASGGWLGTVQHCRERGRFPLSMRLSQQWVKGRAVLLGDAAHVVHPLAGQGLNIGLADAAALVEVLAKSWRLGNDPAHTDALRTYERWRRSESAVMATTIHALGGLFRPEALGALRRLALKGVARSWFAREAFVRRAAGQFGNAPRLAKGEPLQALLR